MGFILGRRPSPLEMVLWSVGWEAIKALIHDHRVKAYQAFVAGDQKLGERHFAEVRKLQKSEVRLCQKIARYEPTEAPEHVWLFG